MTRRVRVVSSGASNPVKVVSRGPSTPILIVDSGPSIPVRSDGILVVGVEYRVRFNRG